MKKLRIILPLLLAIVMVFAFSVPSFAATTAAITVTNTPQFIAITVSPTTWTVNGISGNSHVLPNTTYYSNPLGDTTAPTSGGAVDGECQFTITNTSNVAIDLTVTSSDMSGGSDNSTNGNTGSAGTTTYGAKSYFSGQGSGAWVAAKSSGSSVGYSNLAATTNIKFGMIVAEQTSAWSGGTSSTFTVTVSAAAH